MEHENMKLKEQEEYYTKELKEWKGQLKPRKQVSFDTFIWKWRFIIVRFCKMPLTKTKMDHFASLRMRWNAKLFILVIGILQNLFNFLILNWKISRTVFKWAYEFSHCRRYSFFFYLLHVLILPAFVQFCFGQD